MLTRSSDECAIDCERDDDLGWYAISTAVRMAATFSCRSAFHRSQTLASSAELSRDSGHFLNVHPLHHKQSRTTVRCSSCTTNSLQANARVATARLTCMHNSHPLRFQRGGAGYDMHRTVTTTCGIGEAARAPAADCLRSSSHT